MTWVTRPKASNLKKKKTGSLISNQLNNKGWNWKK
jgi:hypothetical protein